MKYSTSFVYVVFFVASVSFGSTVISNEEEEEVDARECPLKRTRRQSGSEIIKELVTIQARCLNESTNLDLKRLEKLTGLEQHRDFFRELCNGRPATRDCLTAEYTKWTRCYNETMGKVFTIVTAFFESSFEKGCAGDGEDLAIISDGFHRFTEDFRARNSFVRECMILPTTRIMIVLRSRASLATKIWFSYREMRNFNECFGENIPDDNLVAVSARHMNQVLDEMKCIHPIDDELVVCQSIDSSLIDRTSVCPLRTKDEVTSPVSTLLERRLFSCFVVHEPYTQRLSNATTPEEFRAYFKNYCRRNNRVQHCLSETTTAAAVCLHDAQYKTFKLEHDYLNGTLEAVCFDEGKRFANIIYTAKMLQNDTSQRDGLRECMIATQPSSSMPSIEDPTRLYHLYRQLPLGRQCIVDKTTGDSSYVDDVNALVDDIMAKMKCVDTRDGSVVLCQTLASD